MVLKRQTYPPPTVCTARFYVSRTDDYLEGLDCKVATLSVDPVKSHTEWLTDVVVGLVTHTHTT